MVRNEEMKPIGATATAIAHAVNQIAAEKGITDEQIAQTIGRVKSYVNVRRHARKAWTADELDEIAVLFGMSNAFELIDVARGLRKRSS